MLLALWGFHILSVALTTGEENLGGHSPPHRLGCHVQVLGVEGSGLGETLITLPGPLKTSWTKPLITAGPYLPAKHKYFSAEGDSDKVSCRREPG